MYEIPRAGRRLTLAALAAEIDADLVSHDATSADHEVDGCAGLGEATEHDVSFLTRASYADRLGDCRAAAVIVSREGADRVDYPRLLVADDAYFAFRQAVVSLYGFRRQPEPGVSELARIEDGATIGAGASVGPFSIVAEGAVVGPRTTLHANVAVGRNARIGADSILYPGVVVYESCIVGDRVILHSNTVIGQDGFGHATHAGEHHKIPQVGIAVVEDDVELGANCSIDRGTLGATVIGRGSKFSNNVVVGHGSKIGEHNLFVAFVGLAGSVTTGSYVVMGGKAGISGHLEVGDGVQIAASTVLFKDAPGGSRWYGNPALEMGRGQRAAALHARLPEMAKQLRALEREVAELRRKLGDDGTSE
ncbi:MAG: UDP-3-O-(3-hydroxymyristoyl)glucosamine N-acyltransferase [Thermoanaerobaculia bacterium]|nr:UDP-3-O-(3-hydroxymyristoyl)glucosamine N-acyltransferase [Thermoanaerobaculia bacterium]